MAYTIYNTDGTVLLTLGDGKIDQKYTSLTLIGKNVNAYGEYLNNNFVSMLANFAGPDEPRSPLVGQLWYDTAAGRIKVYDLNSLFRPITNTIMGDAQPAELAAADFWFDTYNNQLFFTVDGQTLSKIGPVDSSLYGTTGLVTEEIEDSLGDTHAVTSLYNAGELVGIVSTSSFAFSTSKEGMTSVTAGFNLNPTIPGIRFAGTATSAENVAGIDITKFLRNDINQTTTGSFVVKNNTGFIVSNSVNDQITFYSDVVLNRGTIAYNSTDRDLRIQITNGISGLTSAFYITGGLKNIGVWNETPAYPLDVIGDTRVTGNLYVEGLGNKATLADLEVEDNTIELGVNQSPAVDSYADNGGLILHGTIDHKFVWRKNKTGWNSTDDINLNYENQIYYSVTATSTAGSGAQFTIYNVDGTYSASVSAAGTNYSTATGYSWSTTTPYLTWSTSTPYVNNWSTSTPYVNNWSTASTGVYYSVTATTNNTGQNFTVDLEVTPSLTYAVWNVPNTGTNYSIGDTLTFYGNYLGGTSPANDIHVTVTGVYPGTGGILSATYTGTATWTTSTPFLTWTTSTPFLTWSTTTPYVNYWSTTTPINLVNLGSLLTVPGNLLGGVTPANDLTIRVLTTGTSGSIASIWTTGTAKLLGYQISSSTVLTKTGLGLGVVSAPGLSSVGTLGHLTVTNVYISGNTITSIGTNQDLNLDASGTGNISVNSNKITNLATPSSAGDAANKTYVDGAIGLAGTKNFALTLNVDGFVSQFGTVELGVKYYLDQMFPISNPGDSAFDLPEGVRAKILCAQTTATTTATSVYPTFSSVAVDKDGVQSSVQVVSGIAGSIVASVPSQTVIPVTTYSVQTWKVQMATWTKQP